MSVICPACNGRVTNYGGVDKHSCGACFLCGKNDCSCIDLLHEKCKPVLGSCFGRCSVYDCDLPGPFATDTATKILSSKMK